MCEVSVFLCLPCAFVEKLPFKRVPGPCRVRSLHTSLLMCCSASAAFLPCWGAERSRRVLNFKHGLCAVGASRLRFSFLRRSLPLCECMHKNSPLPAEAGRLEEAGLVHPPVHLAMELAESFVASRRRAAWPPRRDRAWQLLSRDPTASPGSVGLPPPSAMLAALLPLSECSPLCLCASAGADNAGETL